jgi:O-antigen/teichoic acid export membrane protein
MLYILAFLPLIMGIGNVMGGALNAAEKPKLVFYAYLSSGAATLLGGIPLVIHFGVMGAVYGLLLSAATYTFVLSASFVSSFYIKSSAVRPC